MKALNELNAEQLTYLRQKWASESKELERKIFRAQNRLNALVSKQSINNILLVELKTALDNGKIILEHLQRTASPRNIIDLQQQIVDKLQHQYNKADIALNVLTEEEAQLKQAAIDELELFKSFRQMKVAAIDELLAATTKESMPVANVSVLSKDALTVPLNRQPHKRPVTSPDAKNANKKKKITSWLTP